MASKNRKKRRKLKKQLSVCLVVVCLVAAGLFSLLLTPMFNVKNIAVHGNKTISREDIVRGSGIIEGSNIFSVSLRRVRDNLESINRVSSVKVRRVLPSTVSITVEEGAAAAYVYYNGDCVGINAAGRVVNIVRTGELGGTLAAYTPDVREPDEDAEGEESGEDKADTENPEEETAPEPGDEPATERQDEPTGLDRDVVFGVGEIEYKVGKTIKFKDELKGEQLLKLLDEFLCDDICLGVSRVDMSLYDNITMRYSGGLNVNIGPAEELAFKLKSLKAIMGEQVSEDSAGTLDLERLTYSPKNK